MKEKTNVAAKALAARRLAAACGLAAVLLLACSANDDVVFTFLDADCDSVDDGVETDDDGDTVLDAVDNCPRGPVTCLNGTVLDPADPDQTDTDLDLAGDVCDICLAAANPVHAVDFDCNGDTDVNDGGERAGEQCDVDRDGKGEACDNCDDVANVSQSDIDADGEGDACDADADGDGIPNATDNCAVDGNPLQENVGDTDRHGDACDNCPLENNDDQADADADGRGNPCDPDDTGPDDDGIPTNDPSTTTRCRDGVVTACDDNCPNTANPLQEDGDLDGDGTACDNCPTTANDTQADADADGLGDACDACPTDPDNDVDLDLVCAGPGPLVDNCPTTANPANAAATDCNGDLDTSDPGEGVGEQCDSDADGCGDPCDASCP